MMEETQPTTPPLTHGYSLTETPKSFTFKGFAAITFGTLGLAYAGHAAWRRKLKPVYAATLAASGALCTALPWVFTETSQSLRVLDGELNAKDLLDFLKQHPQIEALDLEQCTYRTGSKEEHFALFAYLSSNSSLQSIRGAHIFSIYKFFNNLDPENPPETLKNFCKKLTHFPTQWLNDTLNLSELTSWFALMPKLLIVNCRNLNLSKEIAKSIVKELFTRATPPAFLLLDEDLLDQLIRSYSDDLPNQFFASLVRLPEEIEDNEEILEKILPNCKRLRFLNLSSTVWDLDLANTVALLDPKQLAIILSDEKERSIISALKKGEALPQEDVIALQFTKKLYPKITDAEVAVKLLKNYPHIHFGLEGTFSDQELASLTEALKNSPSPQMKREKVNDSSFSALEFSFRDVSSACFKLASAWTNDVDASEVLKKEDANEKFAVLNQHAAIELESTPAKEVEKLLKTVVPGRVLVLKTETMDITGLIPLNPLAFSGNSISKEQFRTLQQKGYQPGVVTLLADPSGRRLLSPQSLDQFFKNGSKVELLPHHSLFTLSQKEWDQVQQQKTIRLKFDYEDEITGYEISHVIYFAPPNTLLPIKSFNYLLD